MASADIAKAARYTLLSMDQHRSIGQLALRYRHEGNASTSHIAYATEKKCVYGPRFGTMDRFSQSFVVAHETLHHVLGHIEHGALLYKREGSRFNALAFNIACDAIINFVLEKLPDADKLAGSLRYGVRKCQEFGIVNWDKLVASVKKLAAELKVPVDPIFKLTPDKLSCVEIYHALMRLSRQKKDASKSSAGDGIPQPEKDDAIGRIAKEIDAHEDLFDAIKENSTKSEGDLLDRISRSDETLKRAQAQAGSGDAILALKKPDGCTKTPWPQALRRMANNALIHRPELNPLRPARRVVAQYTLANDPRTPDAIRPQAIPFQGRISPRTKAKKGVVIIDTSGSMYADKQLLEDCIRETSTICKRVNTSLTVIFADADVCEVVSVGDSIAKIADLQPKGGGGTDFRPALELAESMAPDLIIYLTDLCGTFPEKAPRAPVIWAYPPVWESVETPFGQRLPLHH